MPPVQRQNIPGLIDTSTDVTHLYACSIEGTQICLIVAILLPCAQWDSECYRGVLL